MTILEMQMSYRKEEDPFDLTLEKWIRIRQFVGIASTLSYFQELLQAANIAVPFCFEYQGKGCFGCPLENVCGPGKGARLLKVMKLIHTHYLAILAGNMLPKEPLISEIDGWLRELEMVKAKPEYLNPKSETNLHAPFGAPRRMKINSIFGSNSNTK